ncbi:hypothetical protein [Nostoc sp. 'Lobaria pulmonaria (5183) cyanobiont']
MATTLQVLGGLKDIDWVRSLVVECFDVATTLQVLRGLKVLGW